MDEVPFTFTKIAVEKFQRCGSVPDHTGFVARVMDFRFALKLLIQVGGRLLIDLIAKNEHAREGFLRLNTATTQRHGAYQEHGAERLHVRRALR